MTKLKDVEGYGIIGGHDQKELEPDKQVLNSGNEWEKAIREYLASGEVKLNGGRPAFKPSGNTRPIQLVSNKQRAALRRS